MNNSPPNRTPSFVRRTRHTIIYCVAALFGFSAFGQKSGPPDKLISPGNQQQQKQYDAAIAPYVAKACATYPAAKKRFLAGLPPNHTFAVQVRVYDKPDKKAGIQRHEDVFVVVETIKKGKVSGWINNKIAFVKEHKEFDRLTFPEEQIMNWLILRPDGTEEGNAVGKFLENYKFH